MPKHTGSPLNSVPRRSSEKNPETFQQNLSYSPHLEKIPGFSLSLFWLLKDSDDRHLREKTPHSRSFTVISFQRLCLPPVQYFILRKWESRLFPTKDEQWNDREITEEGNRLAVSTADRRTCLYLAESSASARDRIYLRAACRVTRSTSGANREGMAGSDPSSPRSQRDSRPRLASSLIFLDRPRQVSPEPLASGPL